MPFNQFSINIYLKVKVWFQNRRMKWRHNKEPHSASNTEDHSPLDNQYTETEVEDLDCLDDDFTVACTPNVILPKEMSNSVRFATLKKPAN